MSINQPLDSLPDMAVFARVVDAGSFSEAARQLGITPSAVSRQVARLEGTLRVRLLERTTRKLKLTDIAHEPMNEREIESAAQELDARFALFSGLVGRLAADLFEVFSVNVPLSVSPPLKKAA